jgi:hypothetical protein
LLASAGVVVFAGFARAQQIDIAVGDSTLFSAKSNSASQAYLPPPEDGGTYPSATAEAVFKNHLGLNLEAAFRYRQGLYNGYQRYRPVLSDVNAVFAPRVGAKTSADLMAGIGGETVIFYNRFANCAASCPVRISSYHFLLHAGVGLRYYFLGHLFVRPEAHYYYVVGNSEFHSGNVLRLGASIGYTFGRK